MNKQEYIEAIIPLLNECEDLSLIDLIFQLLKKQSIVNQHPSAYPHQV